MIVGIGTDIVEIDQIAQLWQHHGERLENDLLSMTECQVLRSNVREESDDKASTREWAICYLAFKWAVKEATLKALRAPHLVAYNLSDIDVEGGETVRIRLSGNLQDLARRVGCLRLCGSAHCDDRKCIAFVVGGTECSITQALRRLQERLREVSLTPSSSLRRG